MTIKKSKSVIITTRRLNRYYYDPPYGTRYWVLSPFLRSDDNHLMASVTEDFGAVEAVRPMADTPSPAHLQPGSEDSQTTV